jgi:hypothetical protein
MPSLQSAARVLVVALVASLGGCGGGSGSSSSSSASASLTSINESKSVAEAGPIIPITVTVTNAANKNLYAGVVYSGAAVASADWAIINDSQAQVTVTLATPGDLAPGTYTGNVEFDICLNAACTTRPAGSPIRIPVTLTVTAVAPISVTASPSTLDYRVPKTDTTSLPTVDLHLTSQTPLMTCPILQIDTSTVIRSVRCSSLMAPFTEFDAIFTLADAIQVSVGVHSETLNLRLCYSASCVNQVTSTPLQIPFTYTVLGLNSEPEPGMTPLVSTSQVALSHDVIDAEYSRALDAVVMASTTPSNALYLYDVTTKVEHAVALAAPPTAVSVSPDGSKAAVGHDALVSVVDLVALGQGSGSAPLTFTVPMSVYDIVLDGRGFVHVFPKDGAPQQFSSVDIATGTVTPGNGVVMASSHARLNPAGNAVYAANLNGSDWFEKIDVQQTPITWLYDSRYVDGPRGYWPVCGNLWYRPDGAGLYTACGSVFQLSDVAAQDMLFQGPLQLSPALGAYGARIESLDASAARQQMALIDHDFDYCSPFPPQPSECFSHVGLYDLASGVRSAVFTVPPVSVSGTARAQLGSFVFYSANGLHRFLISHADATGSASVYYLSEF